METDLFLQTLRHFTCRRGPIKELRSDQGTNFVGAEIKLMAALQEMDDDKIKAELLKESIDWIRNLLQQVISFGNDRFGPCGTLWQHL